MVVAPPPVLACSRPESTQRRTVSSETPSRVAACEIRYCGTIEDHTPHCAARSRLAGANADVAAGLEVPVRIGRGQLVGVGPVPDHRPVGVTQVRPWSRSSSRRWSGVDLRRCRGRACRSAGCCPGRCSAGQDIRIEPILADPVRPMLAALSRGPSRLGAMAARANRTKPCCGLPLTSEELPGIDDIVGAHRDMPRALALAGVGADGEVGEPVQQRRRRLAAEVVVVCRSPGCNVLVAAVVNASPWV